MQGVGHPENLIEDEVDMNIAANKVMIQRKDKQTTIGGERIGSLLSHSNS
jgi:hypothetical protein